ncbi:MAG: tetratricopeptide repeat protein, partial [Catenulispora sp.]|nr:tetratricopeptide repeat protein [Catenulispora sp.]
MPYSAGRLTRAREALDQVLAQPAAGRATAEAVLAERGDDEAAAIAWRAVGLSWKENGDLGRAARSLRRAITVAESVGAPYRAAEARMSLVVILADRGSTDAALAEAALASAMLAGADSARLDVNVGLVLMRLGRAPEALVAFNRAQPVLRAAGDTRWEALLLNTRAVLHLRVGDYREAVMDLLRGERLTKQAGYHLLGAMVQHNLGYVARVNGNLPEALDRLDSAAALYAAHGKRGTSLHVDKADILLAAGMVGEARGTVAAAISEQDQYGFRYNLAEHHLMHARTALADDDPATAAAEARTARGMFTRQRRALWADLARHAEVAARFARGERSAALLREAEGLGDRLEAAKWPVAPHEVRLLAGRVAAELGKPKQAMSLFEQVARHRHRGVAEIRALAWHAQALHALTAGRRTAAEQALRAGLRVHAENNAVLGAPDLRAHAAARG